MAAIIHQEKKRGVAVGLDWRTLGDFSPKAPISGQARAYAADREAELVIVHAVQTDQGVRAALGMFVSDDPDIKVPSEVHSLAALVVHAFPNQPNVILAWKCESRFAVTVITDGIPTVDAFKDRKSASSIVSEALSGEFGGERHRLYTNDAETFPDAELVQMEGLLSAAKRETRLRTIPLRPVAIIAGMLALAILAGGVVGGIEYRKVAERNRLQEQQAESDPLPAYLASLDENINRMGFDRAALQTVMEGIGRYPVWEEGWLLKQIACASDFCTSTWERHGGTTSTLVAARSGEELLPESTTDTVSLRWPNGLGFQGIGAQANAVPRVDAKKRNTDAFQIWRNAKITVIEATEDPQVWPTPTEGDVSRLPEEMVLRANPVEANKIPLPLVADLIDRTPPSIWWNSFTVTFAPGDKSQLLTVSLKGNTYVK